MRFRDPVTDAQQTFRVLLEALARPAVPRVCAVAPAVYAAALTLLDRETPVWLAADCADELRGTIVEGARAPLVTDPARAAFAFAGPDVDDLGIFAAGTPADPETSTTLFVAVDAFDGGIPIVARGPGIAVAVAFAPRGVTSAFWESWERNARSYPQGSDVFFTCGDRVAGFPRTVVVERAGVRAA